jgi:hypothetical protein
LRNRIIGIIAPKGSGKTHKVCDMIQSGELGEKVAVFDVLGEAGYLSCCDEIVYGEPRRFAELLRKPSIRVAYRPIVSEMRDNEEFFPEFEEVFVRLCYAIGNMTGVIDEAHLLCSPHRCPPRLLKTIRIGRHQQFTIVWIAQSWAGVARPLTGNTDEFYFFKVIEPRDLHGIRERCGQKLADDVSNLRRLNYTPEGQVIPGEILHWSSFEGVKSEVDNDAA